MAVLKYKENGVWKNLSFVATQSDTVDLSGYVQKSELLDLIYPVGSIYMSMSNINPSVIFGGTWAKTAAGRVLVGQHDDMEQFDTVGKYGGEFSHTLTEDEIPSHSHKTVFNWLDTHGGRYTGSSNTIMGLGTTNNCYTWVSNGYLLDIGVNKNTGGGQPHNNLQPYLVVNIWERKA